MRIFYCILVFSLITILKSPAQDGFYQVSRLPFTSDRYDEFAPVFYKQGLVFTTNHRTGFLISRTTGEGEPLFKIFYTDLKESGRWKAPGIFSKNLRSNYHDGPVSFTTCGSKTFFTRNIPGKVNETSKLGIYMADYSGGEWTNVRPFQYNNSAYNITHPSISGDGKALYFASDMPGGSGGMDLYVSHLQGENWSTPRNLGGLINSPKDEVFPYIHPGGRLYYSSDNNENGILDLYYSSTGTDNGWRRPVRLPEPLNSNADDFGFIADPDLRTGYLSSNREGTDNIYSFASTFPEFTICDSIRVDDLCFEFYDRRAENIDTATFHLEWDMGDGTRIRGLVADHCYEAHGTYLVTLDRIDIISGEIASSVAIFEFTTPRTEQPFITSPDTVMVGETITFNSSETYLIGFETKRYFWETGDGSKFEGETITYRYSEPGQYEVRLGVLTDTGIPSTEKNACASKYIIVRNGFTGNP
jgi:hypothetical protein